MAKRKKLPPADAPMREDKPKKRKRAFKQGDFVQNVEDASLILIVTQDMEKGKNSFHGTCIAASKRSVGEHERFWLQERFELINVTITT